MADPMDVRLAMCLCGEWRVGKAKDPETDIKILRQGDAMERTIATTELLVGGWVGLGWDGC